MSSCVISTPIVTNDLKLRDKSMGNASEHLSIYWSFNIILKAVDISIIPFCSMDEIDSIDLHDIQNSTKDTSDVTSRQSNWCMVSETPCKSNWMMVRMPFVKVMPCFSIFLTMLIHPSNAFDKHLKRRRSNVVVKL